MNILPKKLVRIKVRKLSILDFKKFTSAGQNTKTYFASQSTIGILVFIVLGMYKFD